MAERTIPILPCRTLQPVLDFYTALGFEVTFQQKSPNPYASVERGSLELQFFGVKHHDPAASMSTCYVVTDDVDGLYAAFRAGLKEAYGRIPTRGLPRLGALRDTTYGMRQFLLTDPGGNCVRVGQRIREDLRHDPAPAGTFARALHHAALLADSREDPAAAAKVIDHALAPREERPAPVERLRLLVLRADVAGRLGDEATLTTALAEAAAVPLDPEEREAVRDDLVRLEELQAGRISSDTFTKR
ncbi:bleomycin resistance protein [Streptomyces sp. NPDC056049]|uniref:bleomycin resistance protein n=1 Tax=Streptomyces sp. NPDC056049 TaxID=3345693 RepID=UPI0035D8306A